MKTRNTSKGKTAIGCVIFLVAFFLLIGACSALVSSDPEAPKPPVTRTATPDPAEPTEEAAEETPEEAPEGSSEPEYTVSQENAIRSAESYLDLMGFSKAGLIEQLSSEYGDGFDKADAEFAVEHIDADWKAEAVEAGQSYLDLSGFSRSGLIEQLSSPYGDQFTLEQATYAADKLGL